MTKPPMHSLVSAEGTVPFLRRVRTTDYGLRSTDSVFATSCSLFILGLTRPSQLRCSEAKGEKPGEIDATVFPLVGWEWPCMIPYHFVDQGLLTLRRSYRPSFPTPVDLMSYINMIRISLPVVCQAKPENPRVVTPPIQRGRLGAWTK